MRAMTISSGNLANPVISSSAIPSARYCLVVSGTHVVKGQNSDGRVFGKRKSAYIAEKGVPQRSRLIADRTILPPPPQEVRERRQRQRRSAGGSSCAKVAS